MQIDSLWPALTKVFANQKVFWTRAEFKNKPTVTDRLIHYLISYYEMPNVARKAVRIFKGIEGNSYFSWDEVRISSLREIRNTLIEAGGIANTWELAVTIKDFLQNAFDVIFTIDLSGINGSPKEMGIYLRQLSGSPEAMGKDKQGKLLSSPYRSYWSTFNRRRLRLDGEQVIPDFAIKYLKYLLSMTKSAPYDPYMDRILLRLGVTEKGDLRKARIKKYNQFMGIHRTVRKHKKLVMLAKTVCLSKDPRCNVCPLTENCRKVGVS